MARPPKWEIDEALILLDALIRVRNGEIKRKDAVQEVSNTLRQRAVDKGMEIDDKFRNYAGIDMQFSSMEYAFTDGEGRMKHASKMFQQVVDLYRSDRAEYERLLAEAKGMPVNKSREERFSEWLAEHAPSKNLGEYNLALANAESFCLRIGVLKEKLFEVTDVHTVNAVLETVQGNRLFRFFYKRQRDAAEDALRQYRDFLKDEQNTLEQSPKKEQNFAYNSQKTTPPVQGADEREQIERDRVVNVVGLQEKETPAINSVQSVSEFSASQGQPFAKEGQSAPQQEQKLELNAENISQKAVVSQRSEPERSEPTVDVEEWQSASQQEQRLELNAENISQKTVVLQQNEPERAEPTVDVEEWQSASQQEQKLELNAENISQKTVVFQQNEPERAEPKVDFEEWQSAPQREQKLELNAENLSQRAVVLQQSEPEKAEPEVEVRANTMPAMTSDANVLSGFSQWLQNKYGMEPKSAQNYVQAIFICEDIAREAGLSPWKLHSVHSDEIKKVAAALNDMPAFWDANAREDYLLASALHYYINYISTSPSYGTRLREELSQEPDKAAAAEIAEKRTEAQILYDALQRKAPLPQGRVLNFKAQESYSYTKPMSFRYRRSVIQYAGKSTWAALYRDFIITVCKYYPIAIEAYKNKSLIGGTHLDLADKMHKHLLRKAEAIPIGWYVEMNLSADGIVKRIGALVQICRIRPDAIEITYVRRGEALPTADSIEGTPNLPETKREDAQWTEDKCVDFVAEASYIYTKPTGYRYCGTVMRYPGKVAWARLYQDLLVLLQKDHSAIFSEYINKSILESGKIDFADDAHEYQLIRSKVITAGFYAETNYSAEDIIKRIDALIKLCGMRRDDIEISYVEAQKESEEAPSKVVPAATEQHMSPEGARLEAFSRYMLESGMKKSTAQGYVREISICNYALKKYKLFSQDLWEEKSAEKLRRAYEQLFAVQEFRDFNLEQHHAPSAAFNKYIQFCASEQGNAEVSPAPPAPPMPKPQQGENKAYRAILEEFFSKGFRMESMIDMKKFRKFYLQKNGSELTESDEAIRADIASMTINHEGKAYLSEKMLSAPKREQLLGAIEEAFAGGTTVIYYRALFERFKEDFAYERIYTPEMLRSYLDYVNAGRYAVRKNYIARDASVQPDPTAEIREYLLGQFEPVPVEAICEALPHLTDPMIKHELACGKEFIWNARGVYFHADMIDLSDRDLEEIAQFLENCIAERGFVVGGELYAMLQANHPELIEQHPKVSMIGMRDCVGYKLRDRFSFKGNIISRPGEALTMKDVYARYCESKRKFTLDELNVLKDELGATIYFDVVYAHSLRISRREFVSRDQAQFDVEATDRILDQICRGDYMPIADVQAFGTFPYAGFPWNEYLLEHYAADFSGQFQLMHVGYSANVCAGAIVRRSSGFEEYDDVLTDVLAKSAVETPEEALDYLTVFGYLGRSRYEKIGQILDAARAARAKKEG